MNKKEWMEIWEKIFNAIENEIAETEIPPESDIVKIAGIMKTFAKTLKNKKHEVSLQS